MNKLTSALLLSLSLGALGACTVETGSGDVDMTQTLTGSVGGQTWTFAAGETDSFFSDADNWSAELYPSTYSTCGFSHPSSDFLIVSIPKQLGEYEMGSQRNMTFVVGGSQNLISFDGKIIVDEITPTSVRGGLVGSYDGANEVNGTFDITICND